MRNLLFVLLGALVGFGVTYIFFTLKSTPEIKTVSVQTEKLNDFNKDLKAILSTKMYDSTDGSFIRKNKFRQDTMKFSQWRDSVQGYTGVAVPKSFFIGKKRVRHLWKRLRRINQNLDPKDSNYVTGFVIHMGITDTTVVRYPRPKKPDSVVTLVYNRLEPMITLARRNKKLIARTRIGNGRSLLNEDEFAGQGTIVDDSLPCPDECP